MGQIPHSLSRRDAIALTAGVVAAPSAAFAQLIPYKYGTMRPADGPADLIAGIFAPNVPHPSYEIKMGSFPPTYSNVEWALVPIGEQFAIQSRWIQQDIPLSAMTRTGAAANGTFVCCAPWTGSVLQLWNATRVVGKLWRFFTVDGGFALQPSGGLTIKGVDLAVADPDTTGHAPGQLWSFPDTPFD